MNRLAGTLRISQLVLRFSWTPPAGSTTNSAGNNNRERSASCSLRVPNAYEYDDSKPTPTAAEQALRFAAAVWGVGGQPGNRPFPPHSLLIINSIIVSLGRLHATRRDGDSSGGGGPGSSIACGGLAIGMQP